VANVDPAVRDAAVGMGMTGSKVAWTVEVPIATPLILGGLRSAILQVVATATVIAYVSLGGLGRFVLDGLGQQDYPQMAGGAILVAALAIVLDLLMAGVQRVTSTPAARPST
jgi:osmoprotectant transport system permease protein